MSTTKKTTSEKYSTHFEYVQQIDGRIQYVDLYEANPDYLVGIVKVIMKNGKEVERDQYVREWKKLSELIGD